MATQGKHGEEADEPLADDLMPESGFSSAMRVTTCNRRDFLRGCLAAGLCASSGLLAAERPPQPGRGAPPSAASAPGTTQREALFWEALPGGRTRCLTCPNHCERGEGGITACRTRINRGGKLYTLTYGKPCEITLDPLAKNPLYHVDPGAEAIGVATAGCNLICKYCQNWAISQVGPDMTRNFDLTPEQVARKAVERNVKWITFSYTEPVAYLEYLVDVARAAAKAGIRTAAATAGFICDAPLKELIRHVNAFSVTLKGYSQEFYRDVCGCNLDDVMKSIATIAASGKWMEVVTLIVPGMNDEDKGIQWIAGALAKLNRDIPLHFLRFEPQFKLKHLQRTPLATLERARVIAVKAGLNYVYLDLSGHEAANTTCPRCSKLLIERAAGFLVIANRLRNGKCPQCSTRIPGIFPDAA
ncbi:MAG: AmmeMemoRadiSam system radical SAM enzyme [Verrucomicrobiota bacterium]|nr:AmmeMemoRadiSam system radical SAM enzyme [Verrucomicrobiota bacterium]